MIRGHQLDGLGAEQPNAVEHATVQQHAAEPQIVRGGGHEAAAPGNE
jgi:hypothetical protein